MIAVDVLQGSQEWIDLKLGVASASNFSKIITPFTGKPSTQVTAYRRQLISEKLTGQHCETYQSEWMKRGNIGETEARDVYAFITGNTVEQTGFVFLNEDRRVGCSPDGLIDKGGLEIKYPAPHTHVGYLLDDKLPTTYYAQVQGSMWVCGVHWWDFMSYCPGMRPFIIRVKWNESFISPLSRLMDEFLDKMDQEYAQLA